MAEIPLLYKDRREEGDTVLRQCQLVQLHLLHVLDAICKKHGIPYVLDGGTLIGAMRHGGFIPWDDDLDVAMMKKDYVRFLRVAQLELPSDTILVTPKDVPERVIGFSKLRDAYSFFAEVGLGVSLKRPNGCFIDVFPMIALPKQGPIGRVMLKLCKWSYHLGRGLRCSGIRGWRWALFGPWLSLPLYACHYFLRAVFSLEGMILQCKEVYYDFTVPFMSVRRTSEYFPHKPVVFEDGEFPAPCDSDSVLTRIYGDWRVPVSPEFRKGGHAHLILPFQSVDIQGSIKYPSRDCEVD